MRFIYADPSLVDNVGHPNTTCRLVTRGLRQRGIEPEIYAYKDVIPALRAEIGAKPHFHAHAFYGPDQDPIYGWLKTFHSVSEATLYDLSQLPALEPGDLVYFNSAQPPQLMALVLWLTTLPPERAPQVVVEFATEPGLDISIMPDGRYACTTRDPRQDARAPFYRFAGSKISPHVEKHLHMMTFEPQSSAIYSSLIQHPVGRLPLPQNAIAPLRRRPGGAPLTVAVLGHQRVDKGYLLVPEIARLLLAKRSQIRLLIHNGAPTQMPEAQRVVRSLAASEPRIIVDERTAGPPIWAELLNASDLIVCPYPADRFRVAPSFVAVEGIANAIPVVGPALTSIDRLIQEWGGCGTVFGEHEPNSIVAATVTVIDDFARYAALAYAAAERWPQRNGPDRLVDAILACAAQPAHAVAPLTTTMQAKPEGSRNGGHHPIFEKFERTAPFDDDRYHHNFMGARIAHEFELDLTEAVPSIDPSLATGLKASGRSARYDEDPRYPYKLSEDYFEWIDLLEAIDRSNSKFTMIEVGAGFGRWIANAAAAIRRRKNGSILTKKFIALEANQSRFDLLVKNCEDNEIPAAELDLVHAACTPDGSPVLMTCNNDYGTGVFRNEKLMAMETKRFSAKDSYGQTLTIEKVPAIRLETLLNDQIDFLDMDIQGTELEVIRNCVDALDKFVKAVHIGTHSSAIDAGLSHIFRLHGWHPRYTFSCGQLNQTPYGTFRFVDGMQSWINPRIT